MFCCLRVTIPINTRCAGATGLFGSPYIRLPSTPSHTGSPADQLIIPYADLGFVASASDSYKSTAGDIFKVYVDGLTVSVRVPPINTSN